MVSRRRTYTGWAYPNSPVHRTATPAHSRMYGHTRRLINRETKATEDHQTWRQAEPAFPAHTKFYAGRKFDLYHSTDSKKTGMKTVAFLRKGGRMARLVPGTKAMIAYNKKYRWNIYLGPMNPYAKA